MVIENELCLHVSVVNVATFNNLFRIMKHMYILNIKKQYVETHLKNKLIRFDFMIRLFSIETFYNYISQLYLYNYILFIAFLARLRFPGFNKIQKYPGEYCLFKKNIKNELPNIYFRIHFLYNAFCKQ